jgi:hypothetical protein
MVKPEKVFRTRFDERECPKCKTTIIPITNGKSCEMHGFKLGCPLCHAFIGWGGKTYFPDKVA